MSLSADSMSPADIAACTGNCGNNGNGSNDMWGGNGAWWIILFFIFAWGWGGFGNGFVLPTGATQQKREHEQQRKQAGKRLFHGSDFSFSRRSRKKSRYFIAKIITQVFGFVKQFLQNRKKSKTEANRPAKRGKRDYNTKWIPEHTGHVSTKGTGETVWPRHFGIFSSHF